MKEKSVFDPRYRFVIDKLVAMRKAAGLTQRDVANKLGCVRNLIARLELGERRIDFLEVYDYCRACGHNPERVCIEILRQFKAHDRRRRK